MWCRGPGTRLIQLRTFCVTSFTSLFAVVKKQMIVIDYAFPENLCYEWICTRVMGGTKQQRLGIDRIEKCSFNSFFRCQFAAIQSMLEVLWS